MLRQTLCVALLLSLACGDSAAGTGSVPNPQPAAAQAADPGPAPAPAAAVAPARAAGAVTGKITFEGTAPERESVDVKQDQVCVDLHKEKPLMAPGGIQVGAGGGLRDVFVQLT